MLMLLTTAEQMRELDRRASDEFGIPSIILMENAGLRTFDVVYDILQEIGGNRVTVVCGKGNNGGDGFVVARHLSQAGADVEVYLIGRKDDVKGDARVNLKIAEKSDIPITELTDLSDLMYSLDESDLIVDAIFGTGIKGEITGLARDVIDTINASGKYVVSVDMPSGLDSDTGQVLGSCVKADATVTFALPKIGLAAYPGISYAGEVTVVDIGIPELAFRTAGINTFVVDAEDIRIRLPKRPADANKGTFGKVAIIAGSAGMTGAAAMAGMAAVRIGAGLVTLGVPESLNDILEAKVTEVMTVSFPETPERSFSRAAVEKSLELIRRCDAVAIGPGIGRNPETVAFVHDILPKIDVPLVIDADGLNAIAEDVTVFEKQKSPAVITPHPGEMARLTGTPIEAIQSNRLKAAKDAAVRFGVTVVLKGAATVTASPDGEAWVNSTGSVALASGGTGDVLTGAITGLLAQGLSTLDAAICGVYIHGRAGELAEERYGSAGTAATDLLPLLPLAINL